MKPVLRPVDRLLLALCDQVSSPRSVAVRLLVENGEWDQLAGLRVDPSHYDDPQSYWADAQLTEFLRKDESLPTTYDREAAAVANFWLAEKQCASTNVRLAPYLKLVCGYPDEGAPPLADEVESGPLRLILLVRKVLALVLGSRPPEMVDGRFGPGATFGDRGQLTTVADKMQSHPTYTREAWTWLIPWAGTAWATACATAPARRDPSKVCGNRFTTVPKDCVKDRGIAVEPSINLFYQLGLGRYLKSRLRRVGLDLTHGQETHKRVACEASRDGSFATIDLSNASDTVARGLVRLLLPKPWYEVLSSLRSPKTLIRGKWVWLEKFSSMGNGFTFELETAIFAAITAAVQIVVQSEAEGQKLPEDVTREGEFFHGDFAHLESREGLGFGRNIWVFGDDIICRTGIAHSVISALRWFGFSINAAKSFVGGPFRESCGGDFFAGVPVRAHYVKDDPSEPQHFIAIANGLRRAAMDPGLTPDQAARRWDIVRRAWFRSLDQLPGHIRSLRGPEALGDLVIHDDESKWAENPRNIRWRSGIRFLRVYRPARYYRVGWEHFRTEVKLATALYGSGDEPGGRRPEQGLTPRDSVIGYKVGWVPFS